MFITRSPELSDDIFRYIWDGRVWLHGINPFRYAPLDPALASLRDELWARINNPGLPTIYPPLLQGVFALAARISPTVLCFKTVFAALDLGAGLCLFSALRRAGSAPLTVLYLWHPAVVVEFAGQGHADAAGLCCLALALVFWARRRPLGSALALAGASLVKLLPLAAFPALIRPLRFRWFVPLLAVGAAYLPFVRHGVDPLGSLGTFAADWKANAFLFGVWAWLPGFWARGAAAIPAAAAVMVGWKRGRPWPEVYSWSVGLLLLFSPVVHPWYVLWLLPVALWLKHPAWVVWSFLAPFSYAVLPRFLSEGVWAESPWVKAAIYLPVLAVLVWRIRRRTGPNRGRDPSHPRPA